MDSHTKTAAGLTILSVRRLCAFFWRKRLCAPLHAQLIRDHSDELAVGGLVLRGADLAAEGGIQRLDAAPVPRYLDGVTDGPLHLAGGRAEMAGDAGIQLYGQSQADF